MTLCPSDNLSSSEDVDFEVDRSPSYAPTEEVVTTTLCLVRKLSELRRIRLQVGKRGSESRASLTMSSVGAAEPEEPADVDVEIF